MKSVSTTIGEIKNSVKAIRPQRRRPTNCMWARRWLILAAALITAVVVTLLVVHKSQVSLKPRMIGVTPTIFFVTAVDNAVEQAPDLIRLSNTLRNIPGLHWVVVEDNREKSRGLRAIIASSYNLTNKNVWHGSGVLQYSHILAQMSPDVSNPHRHKYVIQYNAALSHISRLTGKPFHSQAVVYFGASDIAFDSSIFDYIRQVERIGVWSIGSKQGVVRCVIDQSTNQIIGWEAPNKDFTKYAIDLSAFAVNAAYLTMTNGTVGAFSLLSTTDNLVSDFIHTMISNVTQLEHFDNCTRVYVWSH